MKIVCATNMPFAREAFGTLGDTRVVEGRAIAPADVRNAGILAIRSTTRVDRSLLDGSTVRFVGTATIGTDHMDIPYLEKHGIRWCHAPGCNANSVSEYLTSALLCLAARHNITLQGKTIGVIGVGNVGSLVVKKAEALGMRVLQNDPPRERLETGAGGSGQFVPLDDVLSAADVVTLHVPLSDGGLDATRHMAGAEFFGRMRPGGIFINAARGATTDTDALLRAMDAGIVRHAVLDTWEGEPRYRTDILGRADLGTPHIAGHSFEGKFMGTVMVYREVCRFLGVVPSWSPDALLPEPPVPAVEVDAARRRDEDVLWKLVRQVYDIEDDDRRLRNTAGGDEASRAEAFDRLRKDYPMRREFRFTRVSLKNAQPRLLQKVSGLGFLVT